MSNSEQLRPEVNGAHEPESLDSSADTSDVESPRIQSSEAETREADATEEDNMRTETTIPDETEEVADANGAAQPRTSDNTPEAAQDQTPQSETQQSETVDGAVDVADDEPAASAPAESQAEDTVADETVADETVADETMGDTMGNGVTDDGDSDLELFERYLEEDLDFDLPGRGDLREGIIVEIRPSELLVNVGSKRDGVVPQSDLSRLDSAYVNSLQEGQTVDVVISRQADDDGIFTLSIADALQQKDWIMAQQLLDNGEITQHTVVGFNKGGLTVEFNHLRGFVPASHVVDMPRNLSEEERRAELESHIGQEMNLKVIEVERRRRRLVMSESLAERELRAHLREALFETISVGDVIEGEVRSLRPFGAFIDVGGADGLLHVSEIGWHQVNHPREEMEVGDKVRVQVIRVEKDRERIALSRKRLLPNPWDSVEERYHSGETIPVKITRVVDFGAFAELEPGIEGLIHISELADIAVAEPLKTVQVGDEVEVKILRVDAKRQRVGLSLRQALPLEHKVPDPVEPEPISNGDTEYDWDIAEPEDAEQDEDEE